MKKLILWIKKQSYFVLLIFIGLIYLRFTGKVGVSQSGELTVSTGDTLVAAPTVTPVVPPAVVPEVTPTVLPEDTAVTEASTPTPVPQPTEPVYISVEDDYFADALFIGDSRTVGMQEYGGLEGVATFYAATGLTVYKLFDTPLVEIEGQKEKLTIEEALQERQFGKIYFMIGINEMGMGTVESFVERYAEAVIRIRELQPEAVIYLQGIMKVTTERSNQGDYIHNEGIQARNEKIAGLADNARIFYLDVNPLVCDETGGMIEDYTFDGVHLKAQYTTIWKDYLKNNAVEKVAHD